MQDGQGLEMVGHYTHGNDGLRFNRGINADNFNFAVRVGIATARHNVSDHLPVLCVLQLPAKISAASQLDFGTVITGAIAEQALAAGRYFARFSVPGMRRMVRLVLLP